MKIIDALLFGFMAICLLPATSNAQDRIFSPSDGGNNGLTVSGHAEVIAKPDVAYASLGVVVQAPDQTDAVAQDAAKAAAVKQVLIKAGVDDADIKTDSYQVSPQYDYRTSPGVLVGYQVVNVFKVTIHNLPKAGLIVDKASSAGANQIDGVTFDLNDRSQIEGQALAAAVTNARSKADLMAGAAGITLGRLINLSEGTPDQAVRPMPFMMSAARVDQSAPTTPIQQSDIVIDADVTALYAIGYGK